MAARGLLIPTSLDLRGAAQDFTKLREQAKKAGTEAGKQLGDEVLKGLRAEFTRKKAQAKEAFERGLISKQDMRKLGNDAAKEFNAGVIVELDRLRTAGRQNTDEFMRLQRSLKAVGTAGVQAGSDVRRGLGGAFDGLLRSTRNWIGAIAGFAGLRVFQRFLRGTLDELSRFDSALTQSLAIMGDVPEHLRAQMAESARRISREMNIAAEDVGRAFFFLASAGLNAEQSIAALPLVAQFAKAGMFDLQVATDLLTDAQSALGLTTDDTAQNLINMTRVSDVLVKANTLANATVQQFSEALTSEAGAAMKAFNIDIEEGVAVLAAFADQGVKGQTAGTGFSRILRLVSSAAVNNREEMRKLGIELLDTDGNLKNLADVVEQIENALEGMSDVQRTAALESIGFQARVQGILLPLLGTSQAIRDYEAGLRDAGNITADVASRQMAAIEERLGRVGQKWADLKRFIGEVIALPLAEWFLSLSDGIISTETPLDRAIAQMRAVNREATELLESIRLIETLRDQVAQMERDVARAGIETGRIAAVAPGAPAIMERVSLAGLSGPALAQLRGDIERQLEAAVRSGEAVSVTRLTESLRLIDQFVEKQGSLRAATEALQSAEENLGRVRERFDLSVQIRETDRQIRELLSRGEESAAVLAELERLETRKAELEQRLAGPAPEPTAPGKGEPPDDELVRRRLQLQEQLADRLARLTKDAADEALMQLDRFEAEWIKAFGRIDSATREKLDRIRASIQAVSLAESFRDQIREIGVAASEADPDITALVAQLNEIAIAADKAAEAEAEGTVAREQFIAVSREAVKALRDLASAADKDAARGVESLQLALRDVRREAPDTVDELRDLQQRLLDILNAAREARAAFDEQSEAYKAYSAVIEQLLERLGQLEAQEKRLGEQTERERIRNLREQARAIQENVNAVLELAQAFGLLGSEAAQSLQHVAQLAVALQDISRTGTLDALPAAIGATAGLASQGGARGILGATAGGAAIGFTLGGPIGAAVGGLAGFVGGIFGAGKAAKEAARQLAELTAALQDDIRVRELIALGQDEQADRLRLQLQHERELAEARKAGIDARTIRDLERVQALERQSLSRRQAEAAGGVQDFVAQDVARSVSAISETQGALLFDVNRRQLHALLEIEANTRWGRTVPAAALAVRAPDPATLLGAPTTTGSTAVSVAMRVESIDVTVGGSVEGNAFEAGQRIGGEMARGIDQALGRLQGTRRYLAGDPNANAR